MSEPFNLDERIRKIANFPKEGVLFYDITSILTDPEAFRYCLSQMEVHIDPTKVDALAAIEARGFLFAAPFAAKHGLPLILVRKKGKLPGETLTRSYDLEYGSAEIEIHKQDIPRGGRVFIVDDLIATGGTILASAELLAEGGAEVAGIFGVLGLPFLRYREVLADFSVTTLIDYDHE